MSKQDCHAVAFVLRRPTDGAVLMEWRDDGVFSPGKWSFPGGKIEQGEDVYQALGREVVEELGIEQFEFSRLKDQYYRGWQVTPFLLTEWEGELPSATLDAGARLEWKDPADADISEWPPAAEIAYQVMVR